MNGIIELLYITTADIFIIRLKIKTPPFNCRWFSFYKYYFKSEVGSQLSKDYCRLPTSVFNPIVFFV